MTIEQQLEQKGLEAGLKQGRAEGAREAALDIARKLLASGLDKAAVKSMTGLSDEDLAQLSQ
ncbi:MULTISPECIES: hypothetical protein [Streptomyces]|uniref:hypothetical protein n=1 Tax=Streptomyces TaxID=1883 RepID=UPI000BF235C9|nr:MULTISPECIES: hypothetical protein [Streptomyces]UPT46757.1 hypothetical protein MWG59_38545 [Streptomyces sp. WAC00303]WIY80874.1 hypothetical protein QPM16_38175 [Streptomyces anulatus]